MFGANPFACIYFAEATVFTTTTATPGGSAGRPGGKKRRRKKKPVEEVQPWNVIWPREKTPEHPSQIPVEVLKLPGGGPPQPSRPIAVSPALAKSLLPKRQSPVLFDPITLQRLEALRTRAQQELDDEEALLLLGAFD